MTVGGAFPFVTSLNVSDVSTSDLGKYTCTASNSVGDSSVSIDLTVKSEFLSLVSSGDSATNVGQDNNLLLGGKMFFGTRSAPSEFCPGRLSVVASRQDSRVLDRNMFLSWLSRQRTSVLDKNFQCCSHPVFTATPDAPTSLLVTQRTWESLHLEWTPGFNGGYAQAFLLTYRSDKQYEARLEVKPPGSNKFNVTGQW